MSKNGFGFTRPDDGSQDLFVRVGAIERAGWRTLNEGQCRSTSSTIQRGGERPKSRGGSVADHRFRAGQRVTLAASMINRSAVRGGYVIMKQLPERDGEFEYRIKSASETHERVARESDLARE